MARFTDTWLAAAGLALACGPALAERPMTTDDAPVLDARDCLAQAYHGHVARDALRDTSLELDCGIGWQTQVNLVGFRLREGSDSGSGWSLSGKTALYGQDGGGPAFTVSYGAARVRMAGAGTTASWITGIATWPLADKLALHTNLGWQRDSATRLSSTFTGAALELKASERLDTSLEAFVVDREAGPWVQLGLRYALLPERWSVNASLARQAASGHAVRWTLGTMLYF